MALKGFGEREYGFQGLPQSRYEQAIKARKEAAERMTKEAEAKGKGAATMAAKWLPRIAGTAIGAYAGQPMAGYAAGSAVGDVAAGIVADDPEAAMRGLEQAPQAIAGGMKVAEGLEGAAPTVTTSQGLEVSPEVASGAQVLEGMDPRVKEIYDGLSPEMQQQFLRNQAFAQATTQQFSLPGFAGKP